MAIEFEKFLNIRYAAGASFRSDGDRVAFLTDISGSAQIWTMEEAMGWPQQRTFFEDRVQWCEYHPQNSNILFGQDHGGNEETAIFEIPDSGGSLRKLSSAAAKHMRGCWSENGDRLAWSHNGRNGTDFDVYVVDYESGAETLVWSPGGWCYAIEFVEARNALLCGTATSNANSDLFLVSLDSGEVVHLTEHEGEVGFWNATPAPDGDGFYITTNQFGDFLTLAHLGFDGKLTSVDDQKWDVSALHVHGSKLILNRNVGGYSTLQWFDPADGSFTDIKTPDGVFGAVNKGPSDDTVSFTINAPDDAVDFYTLNTTNGERVRWTASSLGGVPRETFVRPELVSYESFDGLPLQGLLYRPKGDGPFPVVIDIHGGPESQRRPTFSSTYQYFTHLGIAVFAPNVRGSSGYGKTFMALDNVTLRMDSVKDIEATHKWLVESGTGTPDRIAVMGGSYGGFMVLACMVTYPDLFACGVDIVGIASLVTFLRNTSDYRRKLREAEYGSLEHDLEFLESISPLNHIDNIAAPLMVVHGRNDPRVPVSEAEQVVEAVQSRNVPVECLIYDDEGHGIAKRKNRIDCYPKIANFLCTHLKVNS